LYENYKDLSSLTDFAVFNFLYREAVRLTASSYDFTPIISDRALEQAYDRFIKLYLPLTDNLYSDGKVVTLTVALCIKAAASFFVVWNGGSGNTEAVRSQYEALSLRYPTELVALSFGVLVFSVESSRILRAEGYHSSNYVELTFLKIATIRKAVRIIAESRSAPVVKPNYTKNFMQLIRILKQLLDYKMASGRIAKS